MVEWNGCLYRCYNELEVDVFSVFYEETRMRFKILQDRNYKFYIIYNNSKKSFQFTDEDLSFLNQHIFFDEFGDYNIPSNIKFLMDNKFKDMQYFHCVNELEFLIILLNRTSDNYFYYDLILGFKNEFNIKSLLTGFTSNLIVIDNIVPMSWLDLNFDFIKSLFNFEDTIFKNTRLTSKQIDAYTNYYSKFVFTREYIEYKNFTDVLWTVGSPKKTPAQKQMLAYLSEQHDIKERSLTDYTLYKEFFFKRLCTQFVYYDEHYDSYYNETKKTWFLKPEFICFTNFND